MSLNAKKGLLGAEFILWFVRFFLLIIIVVFITYGVSIFYSQHYDIRAIESAVLEKKITDCLIKSGEINEGIFSIPLNCLPELDKEEYYINVSINTSTESRSIFYGKEQFEVLCSLQKSQGKYMPYCSLNKYYVILSKESGKEGANLKILIAIAKFEKNV